MDFDTLLFSKGDWIKENECRDEYLHFQVDIVLTISEEKD
jgi:hypothetical protein